MCMCVCVFVSDCECITVCGPLSSLEICQQHEMVLRFVSLHTLHFVPLLNTFLYIDRSRGNSKCERRGFLSWENFHAALLNYFNYFYMILQSALLSGT